MATGRTLDAGGQDAAISGNLNSRRLQGVALVLLSALVFSTTGLFVKGVGADAWLILYWRGLSATAFTLAWLHWRRALDGEFARMGKPGLAAAIVGALATAAFIPAFKYTSVANVSLIYAAVPFAAAAIAWLWIRETPTRSVLVASLAAFAGVAVIVGGSLHSLNLRGDLLALAMTVGMAGFLCIYRRYPQTPAAGPTVLSSLILMLPALLLSEPLAIPLGEILVIGAFGLLFAIAAVTMAEGARRLPAGETALLSALETPLAPIWAFLLLRELPGVATLVGGLVILVAVFASQGYAILRRGARAR